MSLLAFDVDGTLITCRERAAGSSESCAEGIEQLTGGRFGRTL
ncbi:hypothetical protein [Leptospirillum ferrooxidans]|nr:hypothetical protein [Leptospirillum ferrooxidans]